MFCISTYQIWQNFNFDFNFTCSPDGGQVVPSGKVVFSQAKVPVRDPMASTNPMLNILTVYLTLHKARLTVTVLNNSLLFHSYLLFLSFEIK